jgi:predicted phosphoribosyltransferase
MFRNREAAGFELAKKLQGRRFRDPLVLAIPRGGIVVGAALARELGAELDVVLARKLRAPEQPELAIGAISEAGHVYLNPIAEDVLLAREDYLGQERRHQLAEIARRQSVLRGQRPPAPIADRSVIVTDDGVATGSTMIAALQAVRAQLPSELIVAVPVLTTEALLAVRNWCDEVAYLLNPESLWAIGQFYEDFTEVEDEEVSALLKAYARPKSSKRSS